MPHDCPSNVNRCIKCVFDFITPDGKVYPCAVLAGYDDLCYGSVKDSSLKILTDCPVGQCLLHRQEAIDELKCLNCEPPSLIMVEDVCIEVFAYLAFYAGRQTGNNCKIRKTQWRKEVITMVATETIQFLNDKYILSQEQVAAILKETCDKDGRNENVVRNAYGDYHHRDHAEYGGDYHHGDSV